MKDALADSLAGCKPRLPGRRRDHWRSHRAGRCGTSTRTGTVQDGPRGHAGDCEDGDPSEDGKDDSHGESSITGSGPPRKERGLDPVQPEMA